MCVKRSAYGSGDPSVIQWALNGVRTVEFRGKYGMVWYGMVFIYSTSLYIIYIAHHYNITQDAEREMHEVQYLYVAFP